MIQLRGSRGTALHGAGQQGHVQQRPQHARCVVVQAGLQHACRAHRRLPARPSAQRHLSGAAPRAHKLMMSLLVVDGWCKHTAERKAHVLWSARQQVCAMPSPSRILRSQVPALASVLTLGEWQLTLPSSSRCSGPCKAGPSMAGPSASRVTVQLPATCSATVSGTGSGGAWGPASAGLTAVPAGGGGRGGLMRRWLRRARAEQSLPLAVQLSCHSSATSLPPCMQRTSNQ